MILAIEWTSAAFHAFLFEEDGTLIDQRQQARGVNHVTDGAFEAALREMVGDWAAQASRVYLAGMITSRNGWVETPYAEAPASLQDILARAVTRTVEGLAPLVFLPGVSVQHPLPDMMRGEELKIIGAMGRGSGVVALPGAHTKWAMVENGSIQRFATYMTGEIAALLKANSLVGAPHPNPVRRQSRGISARREARLGPQHRRQRSASDFFGAQHGSVRRTRPRRYQRLPFGPADRRGDRGGAPGIQPAGSACHLDRSSRSLPALHVGAS